MGAATGSTEKCDSSSACAAWAQSSEAANVEPPRYSAVPSGTEICHGITGTIATLAAAAPGAAGERRGTSDRVALTFVEPWGARGERLSSRP
jgi:hypothetical protein